MCYAISQQSGPSLFELRAVNPQGKPRIVKGSAQMPLLHIPVGTRHYGCVVGLRFDLFRLLVLPSPSYVSFHVSLVCVVGLLAVTIVLRNQAPVPRSPRQGRTSWSVRPAGLAPNRGLAGQGVAAQAHGRAARVRSHAAKAHPEVCMYLYVSQLIVAPRLVRPPAHPCITVSLRGLLGPPG